MENNGWIKIHRKFAEWEWFGDSSMVHLFVYLIFSANIEDKKWNGILIKKGQLITSRKTLSEKTGITEQKIRTCLKKMEKTGEISTKTESKYTIISVCKYADYQSTDSNQINIPVNDNKPNDYKVEKNKSTSNQPDKNHKINQIINQINIPVNDNKPNDYKVNDSPINQIVNQVKIGKSTRTKEYNNIYINTKENTTSVVQKKEAHASLSSTSDDAAKGNFIFDFEQFKNYFNEQMNNKAIPKIAMINDRRKIFVNARCREYGKAAVADVIQKAAKSDFLNGGGSTGFVANFDWLFRPTNFPKVLEGNYNNIKANKNISDGRTANVLQGRTEAEELVAELRNKDLKRMQ